MEQKLEIEAMGVCQAFIENEALFGCLEPVKYKIVFQGMGITAALCQTHYEFFKNEAESKGASIMFKYYEINDDGSDTEI